MDKKINSPTWKIGALSSNQINSTEDIKENIASGIPNSKNQTGKKLKSQRIEKKSEILEKVSVVEDSITNIKDSSNTKSKRIILSGLTNFFDKKIDFSNKQSSLKSEELNDEINNINEKKKNCLTLKID